MPGGTARDDGEKRDDMLVLSKLSSVGVPGGTPEQGTVKLKMKNEKKE